MRSSADGPALAIAVAVLAAMGLAMPWWVLLGLVLAGALLLATQRRMLSSRSRAPRVVAIEGLIGAGKSTVMARLAADPAIVVLPERVDIWEELGMLRKFYEDPERYALAFQTLTLVTRSAALRDVRAALKDPAVRAVVLERSFEGDGCFADLCLTEEAARASYDYMAGVLKQHNDDIAVETLVLDVPPDVATGRAHARGRASEGSKVTVDYQRKLWNCLRAKFPRAAVPWLTWDADYEAQERTLDAIRGMLLR